METCPGRRAVKVVSVFWVPAVTSSTRRLILWTQLLFTAAADTLRTDVSSVTSCSTCRKMDVHPSLQTETLRHSPQADQEEWVRKLARKRGFCSRVPFSRSVLDLPSWDRCSVITRDDISANHTGGFKGLWLKSQLSRVSDSIKVLLNYFYLLKRPQWSHLGFVAASAVLCWIYAV